MPYQISIARSDMLKYIQATLMGGMKKSDAYRAFIDPLIGDVHSAVRRLEKRDDFHEILQTIIDTDDMAAKKSMLRVKSKYLKMTEGALDKATDLLENADNKEDKAKAVRLANETFGAMAIIGVANPMQKDSPGALDKGSVVI